MTHYHPARVLLIAGALMAGSAMAACSNGDSGDRTPAAPSISVTKPTLETPKKSPAAPDTDQMTPAAGNQLCDMMRSDIDNWRSQGATVAKVTFNGTVQNWAARNSLTDDVIKDRSIVDQLTTQYCPDVRQQALEALKVQDLASALIGFGG